MSKIITIWGSPNSGKTTLAVKMANVLSETSNVIYLSTDRIAPPLGYILPNSNDRTKSVGKLLEKVSLSQEDILRELITVKNNKQIAYLGYNQYENYKTYAEYSSERASELLINLSHMADYLVIDASSIVQEDILTMVAIKLADDVVRLCGTDLKSITFYKSVLPLLGDKSFNLDRHIKALSQVKVNDPKDLIVNQYGDVLCMLPYADEIVHLESIGEMTWPLSTKKGKAYHEKLNLLTEKIQCESHVAKASEQETITSKRQRTADAIKRMVARRNG